MRKILVVLIIVICDTYASAQSYWDNSRADHLLSFGVRTGVNSSKQYALDEQSDREARFGYQVGLALDLNLCRSFSINSGVMMIQKGWQWDYEDSRGKQEVKDNASYIEIPLLASYRVRLSDDAQFQLNLGPYFAFGLFGDQKVTSTFPNGDNYKIDSFDNYEGGKKFDYGISIGAAFTLSHLYAGLNYERRIVNISNSTKGFQTGCITISLGYNF